MTDFEYRNHELHAEGVALSSIANRYGTPAYIYSRACLERNFLAYQNALAGADHLICYAVKANSNLAVLDTLARLGAGFDIVSIGELQRVLQAGGDPAKIVYSGVAKTAADMAQALDAGIHCFNVESTTELELLNQVAAEANCKAPISLRINPDVDARTHPYISTGLRENKFGIAMEQAFDTYRHAAQLPHLEVLGVDCHIGSQLTEISPFIDALRHLLNLIDRLAEVGVTIHHLDLGGGLGVRYRDEQPPEIADYIAALRAEIGERPLHLLFEPGRSITANAGVLLTRVNIIKHNSVNNFAIIDAAMNDMIRPALYQAWLDIVPVTENSDSAALEYDVVGPVCETGDFLGKNRQLAISEGDLLAVCGAGAYGFTMSSNYNSRTRPPEIMVDGDNCYLVRERETLADLWRGEHLLPEANS